MFSVYSVFNFLWEKKKVFYVNITIEKLILKDANSAYECNSYFSTAYPSIAHTNQCFSERCKKNEKAKCIIL